MVAGQKTKQPRCAHILKNGRQCGRLPSSAPFSVTGISEARRAKPTIFSVSAH